MIWCQVLVFALEVSFEINGALQYFQCLDELTPNQFHEDISYFIAAWEVATLVIAIAIPIRSQI